MKACALLGAGCSPGRYCLLQVSYVSPLNKELIFTEHHPPSWQALGNSLQEGKVALHCRKRFVALHNMGRRQ